MKQQAKPILRSGKSCPACWSPLSTLLKEDTADLQSCSMCLHLMRKQDVLTVFAFLLLPPLLVFPSNLFMPSCLRFAQVTEHLAKPNCNCPWFECCRSQRAFLAGRQQQRHEVQALLWERAERRSRVQQQAALSAACSHLLLQHLANSNGHRPAYCIKGGRPACLSCPVVLCRGCHITALHKSYFKKGVNNK